MDAHKINLPEVKPFSCLPWETSYGVDFYGSLDVLAEYCGLKKVPNISPSTWQHGHVPPWRQVQPEVVVYGAPRTLKSFVGREDEVVYLKNGGYEDVHAIGLPICYTASPQVKRIPESVLVMPMKITAESQDHPDTHAYMENIIQLKDRFSVVAACVSRPCLEKGLWKSELEAAGITIIPGAGLYDANALRRMRALFESFECITTQGYGSSVFYALCFGARVSIWGPEFKQSRQDYMRDACWGRFPEALDRWLSPETEILAEQYLSSLRVPPWEAVQDIEMGKRMVGWGNRRSPEEIRGLFGWTRRELFQNSLHLMVKNSLPWRGCRYLLRKTKQSLKIK
jgi:hypothetical protein